MWRKRRDVVQAYQYSATILTASLVGGRRGVMWKSKRRMKFRTLIFGNCIDDFSADKESER